MSNKDKSITLKSIINYVGLYIKENSIETNYDKLLEACKSIGISSYILNLLILKVKDAQKNECENMYVDLLPILETNLVDEKMKGDETEIIYKRNNSVWLVVLFIVVIFIINLFLIVDRSAKNLTLARSEIVNYVIAEFDTTRIALNETFPIWNSTNKEDRSDSKKDIIINAKMGDVFSFYYDVSSEDSFDWLTVYAFIPEEKDSIVLVRKSGIKSGEYKYLIEKNGDYKFTFKYSKDGSFSRNKDMASIRGIIWVKDKYIRLQEKVNVLCNELKSKWL